MASNETHYTLPRATFDRPVKLLIVVAPYYRDIADQLIAGARAEIEAAGGTHETVEVPGALEVPTAIGIAERLSNFDGYVALGCVIRGETYHFEVVSDQSAAGLMNLSIKGLSIGNGILTTEDEDQAWARARLSEGDKGGGAARAA